MLAIPFVFGLLTTEVQWVHALLFLTWLFSYLFTFYVLQTVRTRKPGRWRGQLSVYGSGFLLLGAGLLAMMPELWIYGLVFLPMFATNAYFASRRRERLLVNDLAAVVQFSLIVFVVREIGDGSWQLAGELFALSIVYFVGTIFYVKTMIREKNNQAFYVLSVVYHTLSLAVAIWLPYVLLFPFAVLLVRAVWLPRRQLTIKQVGVTEIGLSVLVAATAIFGFSM